MTEAFVDAAVDGMPCDEVDFVIVGSGAGGSAAARVLAAAGYLVAVLEEGPLPAPSGLTVVMRETMRRLFRKHGQMVAFGTASIPLLQGCCVGGTTFVNSAIIWRLPATVLAEWHTQHGLDGGLPEGALDAAFATLEAELHVRSVDAAAENAQDRLMGLGAARLGLAGRTIRRSERDCRGTARCLHGCPYGAKQSATVNYLVRAADDGARVVAHARVQRILLHGRRAVGVSGRIGDASDGQRYRGQRFRVLARRAVIVAASAIQSPNLLRRSGVGGAHLGAHFMAHPGTSVMGLYPEPVHMWKGAAQGYEVHGLREQLGVKLETINVPPEVVSARLPGVGARLGNYLDRLDHLANFAVALRAEAQGSVRPSWWLGDLVRYGITANDAARLGQAIARVAEMHFAAGACEVFPGVHGLPEILRSADELRCFVSVPTDPRAYSLVATHLFGGCRAGRDPAQSVVDPRLNVHGCAGLYVMDASVFPSNIGVNPQHTIMALATVAARRLAGG